MRVIGGTLVPAVPREVGVVAVPVAFAVGPVVLVIVGDQVLQGEPVVGGDEVDRRGRAALVVQVGGAGQPGSQFGDGTLVALEEPAHRVTVPAVPFRPAAVAGKAADLVEACGVPRFGDELAV